MDGFIVNYNDACIYQSDLNILRSKDGWINDSIMHFQMTRFRHRYPNACFSTHDFVDPTVVSYFLHQLSLDDSDDIDELRLLGCRWIDTSKEMTHHCIFIPINSNFSKSSHDAFTTGHGLHWSLLLVMFHKNCRRLEFYHFDSSYCFNYEAAQIVASRVKFIFSLVLNEKDKNMLDKDVRITECKCIQQCNGYDCGIHTLINIEAVMEGIKTFPWTTLAKQDGVDYGRALYSQFQRHLEEQVQAVAIHENNSVISMTKNMRQRILEDILSIANDEKK
jgi:Ulp1 family protease